MSEPVGHTPGPWRVEGEDQFAKVVAESGWTVAESSHIHLADLDDAVVMHVANMRLIAASPDLLEACEGVLSKLDYLTRLWGDEGVTRGVTGRLRDALAKAKGGAA